MCGFRIREVTLQPSSVSDDGLQRTERAYSEQSPETGAQEYGDKHGVFIFVGDVTSGSPAELAGIRLGDIITQVDGQSIDSLDGFLASVKTRGSGEVCLKIASQGEEKQVVVKPIREGNLYRIGWGLFGFKGIEKKRKERIEISRLVEGKFVDSEGKVVCGYALRCEPAPVEFAGAANSDLGFGSENGIREIRKGLRVKEYIVSKPGETANKNGYDLLTRFNRLKVPVIVTPEEGVVAFYDSDKNHVVIPMPNSLDSLRVLLHELAHTFQDSSNKMGDLRPHYDVHNRFRTKSLLARQDVAELPSILKSVIEQVPELTQGINQDGLLEDLETKIRSYISIRTEYERVKEETVDELRKKLAEFLSNPAQRVKKYLQRLHSQLLATLGGRGENLGARGKEFVEDGLKRCDFVISNKKMVQSKSGQGGLPFSIYDLNVVDDLRVLVEQLCDFGQNVECRVIGYDSLQKKVTFRFLFPWLAHGNRQVDWVLGCDQEGYNELIMEVDKIRNKESAIEEEVRKQQRAVLDTGTNIGLSVREILDLPYLILERDADLASLRGVVHIKTEARIDLFKVFRKFSEGHFSDGVPEFVPDKQREAYLKAIWALTKETSQFKSAHGHLRAIGLNPEFSQKLGLSKHQRFGVPDYFDI